MLALDNSECSLWLVPLRPRQPLPPAELASVEAMILHYTRRQQTFHPRRNFKPGFRIRLHQKDLRNALLAAESMKVSLLLISTV